MQSELFNCVLCSHEYDRTICIPKLIPSCSHTICLVCLTNHTKDGAPNVCPLDEVPFSETYNTCESLPTNLVLLQILEERQKLKGELCPIHEEAKNLVCLAENLRICRSCADFGKHKGHTIKHINDIKSEANKKREHLESLVNDFDNFQKSMNQLFEAEKKALVSHTKDAFTTIKECLEKEEEAACIEIDNFFAAGKSAINDRLEKDYSLREKMQAKIAELSTISVTDKFFKVLKEKVTPFGTHLESENFEKQAIEFKQKLKLALEVLSRSSVNCVNDFKSSVWPQKQTPVIRNIKIEHYNNSMIQEVNNLVIGNLEDWLIISSEKNSKEGRHIPNEDECENTGRVSLELSKSALSDEAVQTINSLWKQLEKLSEFKIDFSNGQITDREMPIFSLDNLPDMKELVLLQINLHKCCIDESQIDKVVHNIVVNAENIKILTVDLGNTKLGDTGLDIIIIKNIVPKLSGAKEFELSLQGTQVTDKGIEKLFKSMEHKISNLKSFKINLADTSITPQSIAFFMKHLVPHMGQLETIEICLNDTKALDSSFCESLKEINQGWKSITTFILNIVNIGLTDENLNSIVWNLFPKLPKLENFQLNLSSNEEVTDSSVENLFLNLKDLKKLLLNFSSTKITDASVKAFVNHTLPNMGILEVFKLNLGHTQVTHSGITELLWRMKLVIKDVLKSLKGFTLDLAGIETPQEGARSSFKARLKNMTMLSGTEIDLNGQVITSPQKNMLLNQLLSFTKLEY